MKHLIKKMLKEDIETHLDGIVEDLNNPINATLNKTEEVFTYIYKKN
jgi:hypothetical protein